MFTQFCPNETDFMASFQIFRLPFDKYLNDAIRFRGTTVTTPIDHMKREKKRNKKYFCLLVQKLVGLGWAGQRSFFALPYKMQMQSQFMIADCGNAITNVVCCASMCGCVGEWES